MRRHNYRASSKNANIPPERSIPSRRPRPGAAEALSYHSILRNIHSDSDSYHDVEEKILIKPPPQRTGQANISVPMKPRKAPEQDVIQQTPMRPAATNGSGHQAQVLGAVSEPDPPVYASNFKLAVPEPDLTSMPPPPEPNLISMPLPPPEPDLTSMPLPPEAAALSSAHPNHSRTRVSSSPLDDVDEDEEDEHDNENDDRDNGRPSTMLSQETTANAALLQGRQGADSSNGNHSGGSNNERNNGNDSGGNRSTPDQDDEYLGLADKLKYKMFRGLQRRS